MCEFLSCEYCIFDQSLVEKKSECKGTMQFEPLLFKGQLYVLSKRCDIVCIFVPA